MTVALCPDCRAERPPDSPACPRCGLPLTGPVAAELGRLDRELVDVDTRLAGLEQERARLHGLRGHLVARRAALINALRSAARPRAAATQPGSPFPTATGTMARDVAAGPAREAAAVARTVAGEASSHSIQTVLLLLGGLLLAVAAIAFTVFAWSRFGIAGRALILSALTAVTLTVPAVLVKRRLSATGETIAAVGLVLVALDGYAAWRVGFLGVDDTFSVGVYTGIVAAVVTAVAALYPFAVPLRLPRPIAVVTGQAVLPFLASSTDLPWGTAATALVAANLAVVWVAKRHRATPELVLASIGAGIAGLVALGQSGWRLTTGDFSETVASALVLAVLALLGLVAAELAIATVARHAAATSAVLAVAAGAFAVYVRGTDGYLATAAAVLALVLVAVAVTVPAPWRIGALGGATTITSLAAAAPAFWTAAVFAAPLTWLPHAWDAPSAMVTARLVPGETYAPTTDIVAAMGPLTLAVALLAWRLGGRRAMGYAVAVPVAALALLVPVTAGAPLSVVLLVEVVAAAIFGAAALAVSPRALTPVGLLLGLHAAVWSLVNDTATLATVGALALLWTALAAAWARAADARWLGAVTAAAALLAVTGETAGVAVTLDATRLVRALAIFGAAGVAIGAAALLKRRLPDYALAALVTGPISASAGAITGAVHSGRPDVGLLAALASTLILVAAAVAQTGRSGASTPLGAVGILGLGIGGLALLPVVLQAVFGPLTWSSAIWDGAPARAGAGLGADFGWDGTGVDVATLLVFGIGVGLVAGLAAAWGSRPAVRAGLTAAVPCWALAVLLVPLALDAPWVVGIGTAVVLALAGAGAAVAGQRIGAGFALVLGATALGWSLASEAATITVLAIAVLAGVTAGWLGRSATARIAATLVAAAAALGEAGAVAASVDLPEQYPVLGTAAALAGVAALLRVLRPDQAVALEVSAAVGGVAALALASDDTWHSALTLTLAGLAVGLTALRSDRRPAVVAALALELAASWVWLWDAGIRTPEAYTLPTALIVLAVGLVALRRRPEMSSWQALGAGLAGAFLPSLVLVFSGQASGWRSLLLGLAALAVTVAGAATRRQAPFALGSLTLALVALREIWPLLPRIAAAVPAWIPLALGGVLLVVLGATYEQRRNDLRRVGTMVGRMN